jgi:S-formylglutathione hydrolase FrmB
MRRVVVMLVVLLLAGCRSSAGPAPVASTPPVSGLSVLVSTQVSPRVRDVTVQSAAVGDIVSVRLILPAGFGTDAAVRYPVLYLLHGASDSYAGWDESTDVESLVAAAPVLVVMPEGGAAGFYSDWRTGPKWETFHLVELWKLLHEKYQASDVRAIAGLSMGGLGALAYAARHPGTFRAAASFSGVTDTRLSPGESEFYQNLVRNTFLDPDALWGDPAGDSAVWAAHNPTDLAAGLRGTKLFLSVGNGAPGPFDPHGAAIDQSEAGLRQENLALTGRLTSLGIPFQFDDYGPGTHSWPYWQRELHRAWPMLKDALTTP